jgi:hypothetical protein
VALSPLQRTGSLTETPSGSPRAGSLARRAQLGSATTSPGPPPNTPEGAFVIHGCWPRSGRRTRARSETGPRCWSLSGLAIPRKVWMTPSGNLEERTLTTWPCGSRVIIPGPPLTNRLNGHTESLACLEKKRQGPGSERDVLVRVSEHLAKRNTARSTGEELSSSRRNAIERSPTAQPSIRALVQVCDDRLRQPGADIGLSARPRRTQVVDREPGGRRSQVGLRQITTTPLWRARSNRKNASWTRSSASVTLPGHPIGDREHEPPKA